MLKQIKCNCCKEMITEPEKFYTSETVFGIFVLCNKCKEHGCGHAMGKECWNKEKCLKQQ